MKKILGLPLVFAKFFPSFSNFFKDFKVHIFGSIFSLKFSLRLKTVLARIKTLKRYCKATLNMFFFIKKILMKTKKKSIR